MNYLKKINLIIPFVLFIFLITILWYELFFSSNKQQMLALVGEPIPYFSLPSLINDNKKFTSKDLQGKVSLLNVWATWCHACQAEHEILVDIANEHQIPIYGIVYRDDASNAREFLRLKGNPYRDVGEDIEGDVAIDLGIYGTPETYVINQNGKIIYRHIGAINATTWTTILQPLIQKQRQ